MQILTQRAMKHWLAQRLLQEAEPERQSAFSSHLEGAIGLALLLIGALMLDIAVRGAI